MGVGRCPAPQTPCCILLVCGWLQGCYWQVRKPSVPDVEWLQSFLLGELHPRYVQDQILYCSARYGQGSSTPGVLHTVPLVADPCSSVALHSISPFNLHIPATDKIYRVTLSLRFSVDPLLRVSELYWFSNDAT